MTLRDSDRSGHDQPTGVVAALKREIAPLLRHAEIGHRIKTDSGRFFRAEIGERTLIIGWTGDGRRAAEQSLRSLLAVQDLGHLIGLGVAGGLAPELEVGQLVVAGEIRGHRGSAPPLDRSLLAGALVVGEVREGLVYSSDRILSRAADKAACWQSLRRPAVATVDLETMAWATVAAERDVPFLAIRAVSDPASHDLPLDFERYRNAAGYVSNLRVALSALRHPSLIRPLRELQRNVDFCAHRLSAWTVDFALGSPDPFGSSPAALSLRRAT